MAPAEGDEKEGGPTTGKFRVGLRRVYKEREACLTVSHLASGRQDDKQSILLSDLLPPRKA